MKYTLSKKLVNKLIKEEVKKTNINVEILPLTNSENIINIIATILKDNDISYSNKLISIIEDINYYKEEIGVYDKKYQHIKLLLQNIYKITKDKEEYLWNLAYFTYHEYKHVLIERDKNFHKNNLDSFNIMIGYITKTVSDYYDINHDDFYEEILANKYAIKKVTKFLLKFPNIYKKVYFQLEQERLATEIYYQNYDIQVFLDIISKNLIYTDISKIDLLKKEYPYTFISFLYNKNGTLKDLKKLSKTNNWNNRIPLEVKYLIVSSKTFLASIDYNFISIEELNFILEALNYTYNLELIRATNNKKLREEIKTFNNLGENSKEVFNYKKILLQLLSEKETCNKEKIKFLEKTLIKTTALLEKNKNKKLIRTIST